MVHYLVAALLLFLFVFQCPSNPILSLKSKSRSIRFDNKFGGNIKLKVAASRISTFLKSRLDFCQEVPSTAVTVRLSSVQNAVLMVKLNLRLVRAYEGAGEEWKHSIVL